MTTALSPSWFSPSGRTASLKAGLTSYASKQWCSISGHDNIRRVVDNKCCACLELLTVKAQAKEAALTERLRQSALKWARAEVKREAARKVKQEAADKLKAEKLAIRVQAQADRDKAKRARLKAQRAAERIAEKAEAQEPGEAQAGAQVQALEAAAVGALGVPPWEEVSGTGCPWEDAPPWD